MTLPAFKHPWVDETHAPIYISRDPTPMTDAAQAEYIARLETWTGQVTDPYSWIVIPGQLTPRQRSTMSEVLKRLRPQMAKYQLALAFVLPNAAIRGVLSAVFWFAPPAVDYRVFADLADALEWTQKQHKAKRSVMLSSG